MAPRRLRGGLIYPGQQEHGDPLRNVAEVEFGSAGFSVGRVLASWVNS